MKKRLLSTLFILLSVSAGHAVISQSISTRALEVSQLNGAALFSNCEVYGEPGQPLLPIKQYTFLVPPDADLKTITFSLKELKEKVLSGTFYVEPALPPYSKNGPLWPKNRTIVNGRDLSVYSKDAFFPHSYIQDITVGMMRCYKIVTVRVYLSQFNPVSGVLKCMDAGELVMHIGGKTRITGTQYAVPSRYQKLTRNLVGNFDQMAGEYCKHFTFTDSSVYLIMTEASIEEGSSKFADLVASKEGRGFTVKVITESEWGGGTGDAAADRMREWMKENYEQMGIQYLLLIGSSMPTSGTVPMKTTKGNMDLETDYYYQELSGDWSNKDQYPEVCAGRIPVYDNDITTLDNILEKIIAYENAPAETIEWRFNALFAEKPFDNKTPGSKMFEQLKADVVDVQGWDCYRIYNDNNGSPDESSCSQSAVTSAWKADKYGIVEWMTHGSSTSASSIMSSTATSSLGSNDFPPFVCMGSCSNGTIIKSNNLAFSMLENAAIATIGATEMTLYDVGNQYDFTNSNYIQGMVYGFGKGIILDSLGAGEAHDQIISGSTNLKWHNAMAYSVFGCPDIGVYTCKVPTAVKENILQSDIDVDEFSIRKVNGEQRFYQVSYNLSTDKGISIVMYDLHGRVLYRSKGEMKHGVVNIPCTGLSRGVYFCSLMQGNETIAKAKITITR